MHHDNDNELLPRKRAEAIAKGGLHYFTGNPCKHGHLAKRFTSTGGCEMCILDRTKVWRIDNRDVALTSNRASSKKWRETNTDRWRSGYREAGRKYRRNNPEKMKGIRESWELRNPGAAATRVRNRRARLRNVEGSHTQDDVAALLEMQGWKCTECLTSVREDRHVDHIMPVARGGPNYKRNLQILCPDCNWTKGAKDPIDFARERGRLI